MFKIGDFLITGDRRNKLCGGGVSHDRLHQRPCLSKHKHQPDGPDGYPNTIPPLPHQHFLLWRSLGDPIPTHIYHIFAKIVYSLEYEERTCVRSIVWREYLHRYDSTQASIAHLSRMRSNAANSCARHWDQSGDFIRVSSLCVKRWRPFTSALLDYRSLEASAYLMLFDQLILNLLSFSRKKCWLMNQNGFRSIPWRLSWRRR